MAVGRDGQNLIRAVLAAIFTSLSTGCHPQEMPAWSGSGRTNCLAGYWQGMAAGRDHTGDRVLAISGAGFTPGGSLLRNAAGTAGRYSRARGLGADDMLRTSAGLWIASDNFADSATCGDVTGHAGICFLPNS